MDKINNNELAPLMSSDLKFDQNGLIPAIIQDDRTSGVLMLGYMNEESLNRTMESRKVCFWSRSRREYWVKGETSGNFFDLKSITADCDADALLLRVVPLGDGVACHTGRYSCFFQELPGMKEKTDD